MKVSGILPTRGRRRFAAQALQSFLSQTYPDRELVILDDADDPSFPGGVAHELVRYHLAERQQNIPEKRNACCRLVSGEIVAHFDSDDWSAPERLEVQVAHLLKTGKAVTGYRYLFCYSDEMLRWATHHTSADRCWGTSLLYLRSWWERNPFDERRPRSEDGGFADIAYKARVSDFVDELTELLAARAHTGNTAKKNFTSYRRVDPPRSEGMLRWSSILARAS